MDAGSPGGEPSWLLNALYGLILMIFGAFSKMLHARLENAESQIKENETALDDLEKCLVKVEATTLEAEQIRAIVGEQVGPINRAHEEIFSQLREITKGFNDLRVEIEKRLPRDDKNGGT